MGAEATQVDLLIIGGGVVGCALASYLSEHPIAQRFSTVLVEAGPRVGEGITSRNSGVVHAGLYYPPQSLKAETCVRGNRLVTEWSTKRGVGFKQIGKLVVAQSQEQIPILEALFENARASGAENISLLSRTQVQTYEPHLEAEMALWSPQTGIIDQYELTRSFALDAEQNGVVVLLNCPLTSLTPVQGGYEAETARGTIRAHRVINAAGLEADTIAAMVGVTKYKLYPCRGDYFAASGRLPFSHLIYPVKDPKSPGLGVHLTLDLNGRARFGPDAEYVSSKTDFSSAEHKHDTFLKAAQKLLGSKIPLSLSYDSCGIRPKLRAPHEKEEKDFVIAEDLPGLINLIGIESPGLTASMALAEKVGELLL